MAHWALKKMQRRVLVCWMLATVALRALLLFYQVVDYIHAYQDLGLALGSGIYASTFFMLMLPGFHGFHGMRVTTGSSMLLVIASRCMARHFKLDHHLGFQAAA